MTIGQEQMPTRSAHALAGITVVGFVWAYAAPLAVKYLADHGALAIKVESRRRPDMNRLSAPFRDGIVDPDRSGRFAYAGPGPYSLALDLSQPAARDVAKRLVGCADVVVENFRPGVIESLGLGYEELRQVKPDIIMLSSSILGQQGLYPGFAGLGHLGSAMAGYYYLTGWPDREPTSVGAAGPGDYVQALFTATAVMAALDYRSRTGKGQNIDIAQIETLAHFMAPAVLDSGVNGRQPLRMGNRDDRAAPHGAFPCKGRDRWCAIAVFTEQQWLAFCEVVGDARLTEDQMFATLASRKKYEDQLERLVGEWTVRYTAEEVMMRMQSAGVPAGVVQNAEDIVDKDPQLKARNCFVPLHHPELGVYKHPAPPMKLSRTPGEVHRAPCLGEHSYWICTHILGMSDEEFAALVGAGAIE